MLLPNYLTIKLSYYLTIKLATQLPTPEVKLSKVKLSKVKKIKFYYLTNTQTT